MGKKNARGNTAIAKGLQIKDVFKQFNLNAVYKDDFFTEYHFGKKLIPDMQLELFSVFEANMKQLYLESTWGYDAFSKRNEMFHRDSRYFIVKDKKEKVAGFIHFRMVSEDQRNVLYVYEIQIEASYQRLGIGGYLMRLMEELAIQLKFSMVMLTVFVNNTAALSFYQNRLQYEMHESSPELEENGYLILCKSMANLMVQ